MSAIKITLTINRDTGLKDLVIELSEDDDLMQWEHEEAHQAIVEKLLGAGVMSRGEVGDVTVSRVKPTPAVIEIDSCRPEEGQVRNRA